MVVNIRTIIYGYHIPEEDPFINPEMLEMFTMLDVYLMPGKGSYPDLFAFAKEGTRAAAMKKGLTTLVVKVSIQAFGSDSNICLERASASSQSLGGLLLSLVLSSRAIPALLTSR